MRIAAILKARAIARIDVDELNLQGRVRFADIVPALVSQFNFLKYPTTAEEFDIEKGINFRSGRVGENVVDLLTIFPRLITLDTLSSTADSKASLVTILAWGRDNFGLSYREGMIDRWAYISQVTFSTDFPLLSSLSKPLENLARKTTKAVDELFDEGLIYEPLSVSVGHDPLTRGSGVAQFQIQHRANFKFSDNKYFSEAPLPTHLHIKFLEELEADVLKARG